LKRFEEYMHNEEKVKIIKKGLEEAYDEKDEDKLYYVCSAIWEFNLHTEEWIDILQNKKLIDSCIF